jgi:hypothetical protein
MTADDLGAIHNIEQQTPSPWSMSQLEGDFFWCDRSAADKAEILKISTDDDFRQSSGPPSL